LTKGLSPQDSPEWEKYHPYSIQLSRSINNHFNNVTRVKVVDDGVNGELTSRMKHRIALILSKTLYDVVIVLGGTNDLGHHRSKDEILNDIYEIHSTIHNFGIKSIKGIDKLESGHK
jgi:lysophospholipase L1-like esterase